MTYSTIRPFLCGAALLVMAACEQPVPDSGAGVGFNDYDSFQAERARRDAQLSGRVQTGPGGVNAPAPVQSGDLPSTNPDLAARARAAQANSGIAPVNASPSNPAPTIENAAGISSENDFNRVSNQRSIEGDAALIAQNRAQYQVVQPTALPDRAGAGAPNVVAFALSTSNARGQSIYRRSGFNADAKFIRNCARYASPDLAQQAFLADGGPQRDRDGLDPDGDGFACAWDPTPFRAVRG